MRLSVLFSTFVFCATVKSQQSTLLEDYLKNYPQCAAQCVLPVTQDIGFGSHSITDISTKLCPDISSTRSIYFCIQTNCSYVDEVASWPFQEALCPGHQVPSRAGYIRNLTLIMALPTAVFVLLRYYSRICIVKKFRWDDGIMAIAFIFFVSMAIVIVWGSTVGLGLHEWDANPGNVIVAAKVLYVFGILYIIIQGLIKVSILLFYIRVFPDPWIKALTWGFIAFQIFHGVGFLLATVFQCTPVSLLWDHRLEGHCIRFDSLTFPIAVFSIVENISILSLPVPCLWQLNIGRGKKICLLGVFGMGILACVISMFRVKPMLEYVETLDQMWDSIPLIAWSEAELAVATICVCLPSFKAILDHHVPRYFGSQSGSGYVTGTLTPRPTAGNQMGNSNRGQTWFSRQLKTGRLGKPFSEGSGLGFSRTVEGHGLGDEYMKNRTENERGLKKGAVRSNENELPDVVTGHGQASTRNRQDLRTSENKMRKDRDLWMDEVKKTRHLSEIKRSRKPLFQTSILLNLLWITNFGT
ncbi:hypothetical protein LZ554_002301 [Drepanopeziza brunnea f. sp. 'monogermtubi']|nr:hypothetical protein LZ554_002301 [Drepanopeziza brunnea f. sp. 'monogermtubi']